MIIIPKEYDLIIVGAGTAGCCCAIHAANKGLDVCIVDRKKKGKIGNKVCGDLISYSLFDWITFREAINADLFIVERVLPYGEEPIKRNVRRRPFSLPTSLPALPGGEAF